MNDVHAAAMKFGESYSPKELYDNPDLIAAAARRASNGLWIASGLLALLAGLFVLLRRSPKAVYALFFLAVIEMLVFARPLRPTFNLESTQLTEVKKLAAEQKGDFRILNCESMG